MKKTITVGIGAIIAIVFTFIGTLITGGSTGAQSFEHKGCTYGVAYEQGDGLFNMIEDCKLKEIGSKCEVALKVTIIKEHCKNGEIVPVVEPTAEPVKEVKVEKQEVKEEKPNVENKVDKDTEVND